MTISTLRTARLLLRAPTVDDAPVLAASLDNFEISKWLTVVPHPYTQADAQWFIDENLAGRFNARLLWSGDRFIGVMGIDGELGYWLDQAAWGQGYATEAAIASLKYGFNNLKLKSTTFKDSSLQQTDFAEADLTQSTFDNCNLQDAIFENTILEAADFRTAYNINFNPNVNKLKGAKFSKSNIEGLLSMHQIVIE